MNVEKIKSNIKNLLGKEIYIKEYIGRNKYEMYEAKLIEMYSNIFVVQKLTEKKTFSYVDVLIKNIVIKPLN